MFYYFCSQQDMDIHLNYRQRLIFAGIFWVLMCPQTQTFGQLYRNYKAESFSGRQQKWVDSVMSTLSQRQKIGQLFMVAAYSNKDENHVREIEKLIKEQHIGGLIFFQGGPHRQAKLTNRYQSQANIPLYIAIDGEWGLGMRLDSTMNFPKQMTLGALGNDELVFQMGTEIARQCRRMGIHINFAPVVDVNSNPANPVIGYRSFGESKENVASKASAYMRGMQYNGVIAVGKHFPGHGDTDKDSHLDLPVVKRNRTMLDETELYPFRELINDSVMGMMVAHLHVPAIDNTPNLATTLSKKAVTTLLKKELGFDGLIFTDALNMKGVSKFFPPGEVDVKALLAGNDVLLFPENVGKGADLIELALKQGKLKQKELDRRVRKILSFKYWSGLDSLKPVDLNRLQAELHTQNSKALLKQLYSSAVTVAKNQQKLLPIERLDTLNIASLSIGAGKGNEYQKMLQNYAPITLFDIGEKATQDEYSNLLDKLGKYNLVLVDLHKMTQSRGNNYGISSSTIQLLNRLNTRTKVVLAIFGNPYSLKSFVEFNHLIVTYEDNETTRETVPQVIFGAKQANGRLPVTADPVFRNGMGLNLRSIERLQYGVPEEVNMSSEKLAQIDSLVLKILKDKTTPGCQVLVARNGMVVYNKGFGHMSYDSTEPVDENTLYDLASITKTAATLQAIMYLQERGLIDVNMSASSILPELSQFGKGDITIEMLLLHQTGMQPFIPFWKRTKQNLWVADRYYCNTADDWFKLQVTDQRFAMRYMEDSLWKWTLSSERGSKNKLSTYDYKYSDMNFYILKRVVEALVQEPIEDFLERRFYTPLGMHSLLFRPLSRYPVTAIAPTEKDDFFRKTLVRGYVHDQGAAMVGGVGGHAGLFSNANGLAVLTQMNLNKGYYGGKQYLLPQTIPYFTRRHSTRNRRGFGWDKPYMWSGDGPTSAKASKETFGHTGFTGTCVWADPKYNLIYIFLSNRVHPDAENNKLAKNNIRPRIHDLIYEALTDKVITQELPPAPPQSN